MKLKNVALFLGSCLVGLVIMEFAVQSYVAKKTLKVLWDPANNCWCHELAYPDGYNVEIFSMEILKQVNYEAVKPSDREHVTTFITMQPDKFKKYRVDSEKDFSKYRFNLDYKEDFELIKSVLEKFDEKANLDDIINWLDEHPEILKLNSHIKPYENLLKSFEQDKKLGYEPYEKNFYIESSNE